MDQTKICRFCGQVIYSEAQVCEFCKRNLNIPNTKDMFCVKCKSPVNVDDNYCMRCGAIFNIPETNDDYDVPVRHNVNGIPYNIGILLTSLAASFAITVFATTGKDVSIGTMAIYYIAAFIISEIFLYIYFLPTILAIENNKPNALFIYICNLLSGVTVIGWFVSLIFSFPSSSNEQK